MTTKEAVEQLRSYQSQIIHGSNTFGDIADHIELLEAERDGAMIREKSLREILSAPPCWI